MYTCLGNFVIDVCIHSLFLLQTMEVSDWKSVEILAKYFHQLFCLVFHIRANLYLSVAITPHRRGMNIYIYMKCSTGSSDTTVHTELFILLHKLITSLFLNSEIVPHNNNIVVARCILRYFSTCH